MVVGLGSEAAQLGSRFAATATAESGAFSALITRESRDLTLKRPNRVEPSTVMISAVIRPSDVTSAKTAGLSRA